MRLSSIIAPLVPHRVLLLTVGIHVILFGCGTTIGRVVTRTTKSLSLYLKHTFRRHGDKKENINNVIMQPTTNTNSCTTLYCHLFPQCKHSGKNPIHISKSIIDHSDNWGSQKNNSVDSKNMMHALSKYATSGDTSSEYLPYGIPMDQTFRAGRGGGVGLHNTEGARLKTGLSL